jgi:uncharacterized protein with PQ loop repeat
MKQKHSDAVHHFHNRKQAQKELEPYPHPSRYIRFIDRAIYVVAMVGPIMTIPQLCKIWVEQSAAGISVITWTAYIFVTIFWLMYGIAHKEKPIIVVQIAWLVTHSLVVIGALLYK